MNFLTDAAINTARAKPMQFKLSDGKGLYVLIMPNGSKYFRFDYSFDSKRHTLAIGAYPEISLDTARLARDTAKGQIKDGIKPTIDTVANASTTVQNENVEFVALQKINNELRSRLAVVTSFSCLTPLQRDWIEKADSDQLTHLKALDEQYVDALEKFDDDALLMELKKRGWQIDETMKKES
ncbi:MAG: Arm DNA-binding domain-containing protein [Methylococcales bacterium]|nr:Arm DNA-binding domain-containing protein [Methylococcales bacterium]